nr:MAG TPA: anaerobic ribonucleoside triphosphate reductase [Caudoviricetes sp.]
MAAISDTRNTTMNDDEILQNLQEKRTRCIVYTRVMGYHRPVEGFNLGKKGEHKERVKFIERTKK